MLLKLGSSGNQGIVWKRSVFYSHFLGRSIGLRGRSGEGEHGRRRKIESDADMVHIGGQVGLDTTIRGSAAGRDHQLQSHSHH